MNRPPYLQLLPPHTDQSETDVAGGEALEALIERWRLSAFDAYCAIRKAQRERDRDASTRMIALCDAANVAAALAGEIAALRAEVVPSLPDEASYTVLA